MECLDSTLLSTAQNMTRRLSSYRARWAHRADRVISFIIEVEGGRDIEDLFAGKDLKHFGHMMESVINMTPSDLIELFSKEHSSFCKDCSSFLPVSREPDD